MPFELSTARVLVYLILVIFSVVLFGLSVARLHYTTHLPLGDPLHGGQSFHDPIIPEIIATTILSVIWAIYAAVIIHTQSERPRASSFRAEQIGLVFLLIFWTFAVGYATHIWGNLFYCQTYHQCRILTALVAFCWLGWICVAGLLIVSVLFALANQAFKEPMHGRWDPRASIGMRQRESGIRASRFSSFGRRSGV